MSCVFRMVTVRKVTKRSINTQIHCHSKIQQTNFSHFHSVNSALRQPLVHYFSAFKVVHSESTQHSLVRWTDRLEYYFYLCEDHCILEGRLSYSISTKSGGEIYFKDIVSNTSLDLPKVLSQFLFCNRVRI